MIITTHKKGIKVSITENADIVYLEKMLNIRFLFNPQNYTWEYFFSKDNTYIIGHLLTMYQRGEIK